MDRSAKLVVGIAAGWSLVAGAAYGEVLHVRPGGPDFAQIADAVAAAVDGDTILVEAGNYERFAVDNKDLQILGTTSPVNVTGLVRIRNTPRSKAVRLAGIHFRGLGDEALFIYDNLGQVLLQDCAVFGRDAVSQYPPGCRMAFSAAAIEDSDQVVLVECHIEGGEGDAGREDDYTGAYCYPVSGDLALSVYDSNVAIYGGRCLGGHGADSGDVDYHAGGDGGDGIYIGGGSKLWVSGARIAGGDGNEGSPDHGFVHKPYCGWGGDAGDAFELGEAQGGSSVAELGNTLIAGVGGMAGYHMGGLGYPYECYDGSDGSIFNLSRGNTVRSEPGTARRILLPTVALDQDVVHLTVEGEPGDQVSLAFSEQTRFQIRERGVSLLGTLRLGSEGPVATLPATGTLDIPLFQRDVPAFGALELGVQASIVDASGTEHLSNVRWLTLLDPAAAR